MRTLPVFLIALVSGIASPRPASAAEPAIRDDVRRLFRQLDADKDNLLASQEVTGEHARLFTRLIRTSDRDSDGRLTLEEFDRGLSPHRPAKAVPQKQPARLPGADELLLLIAMMDADADGVIRYEEVPERLMPFFLRLEERIGRTEDRQIRARDIAQGAALISQMAIMTVDRLELNVELEMSLLPEKNFALVERLERPQTPGERMADPARAAEMFTKLDANGDGEIVFEEVPGQFAGRFDRLLRRADANGDERISASEYQQMTRRLQSRRSRDTMSNPPASDSEMMVP